MLELQRKPSLKILLEMKMICPCLFLANFLFCVSSQLQANAAAASEAADGPGEQAEVRDGRAPAETGQRAGESEEQFFNGGRETVQEAPGHNGEGGEPQEEG